MPRHLHIDPFTGIAGDMFLAGMLSLGLRLEDLRAAVQRIPFPGVRRIDLAVTESAFEGVRGLSVRIVANPRPDQPFTTYTQVRTSVEAALPEGRARQRALAALDALALAQARATGTSREEARFRELGGLDTVVDLVGAAAGLEALEVESVTCGPLPLTRGTIPLEEGRVPCPADSTLELLRAWPTVGLDLEGEIVTPTGAALATTLAEPGPAPAMRLVGWGTGFGTSVFPGRANCLRLLLGELVGNAQPELLVVLEANLDDLSAELLAVLPDACLRAGALDAWLVPALMKKGRPAHVLHALCTPEKSAEVETAIFRNSSTLGVRSHRVERSALARAWHTVETPWGPVRVKLGERNGDVLNRAPEFEDCKEAAERAGVPIKTVYAEALAAALRK